MFWNTEDLLGFWGSRFGCWGFGSWLCRPRRLRRLNARVTQRPSNRYSIIFSSPSPSVSLFLCDSMWLCNLFLMSFAMAQNYRPPKDNSVANSWFGLCAFISTCLNKVERAPNADCVRSCKWGAEGEKLHHWACQVSDALSVSRWFVRFLGSSWLRSDQTPRGYSSALPFMRIVHHGWRG